MMSSPPKENTVCSQIEVRYGKYIARFRKSKLGREVTLNTKNFGLKSDARAKARLTANHRKLILVTNSQP